jgi:hypothetical protein
MKQRKHRFVVGYQDDQQTVYGADSAFWADPMSEYKAKSRMRNMADERAIIYELVPRPDLGQSDGKGGIVPVKDK